MGRIPENKVQLIQHLYQKKRLHMREVAERLGVSLHAVVYFMRRQGILRRSFSEINQERFEKKTPSFRVRTNLSRRARELQIAGAMLYWGEGYQSEKGSIVDFTNSDPGMVKVFLSFLRSSYDFDAKKLKAFLYCYADQNAKRLTRVWSRITGVPLRQFTKPYVHKNPTNNGKKMRYGVIHIRYGDKKLLLHIKQLIEYYKGAFSK